MRFLKLAESTTSANERLSEQSFAGHGWENSGVLAPFADSHWLQCCRVPVVDLTQAELLAVALLLSHGLLQVVVQQWQ